MCVLRVSGKDFNPEAFLRTSALKPCKVFRAGELRLMSRPDGPVHTTSGFNVGVSDAAWTDLPGQISDACAFLEQHTEELRALALLDTVEEVRLDFPTELRIGTNDIVAQFDYFPPALLKAAGHLGVGVALSIYLCSEDDDEGKLEGPP
jgi:hypothetical protein